MRRKFMPECSERSVIRNYTLDGNPIRRYHSVHPFTPCRVLLPFNCRPLLYICATPPFISSALDSPNLIYSPSPCLDGNLTVNILLASKESSSNDPLPFECAKPADQASFYRVLVNLLLYLFSRSSKVGHINMDVWNPLFRRIHGLQVVPPVLQFLPILRPLACARSPHPLHGGIGVYALCKANS